MLTENDDVVLESTATDCYDISENDRELQYTSLKSVQKGNETHNLSMTSQKSYGF